MPTPANEIPEVRTAGPTDEAAVIDLVTLAFSSDPMVRWLYPDPRQYLAEFPGIIQAFAGSAFKHGSAWYVDAYKGAALWLPPEVQPDAEALVSRIQATVSEERQTELFAVMEQMANYHPHEPHWYLPMIGVDPANQGRGYGSVLMRHGVAACDRDALPAYLESSNPRNVPLYERHGFEVIGSIQAGTSPEVFPMLRRPG
jgi:ribosomal protein S18 acetylase RimI-like enzyme